MRDQTIAIVINTAWNIFNFRLGLMHALKREGYRVVAIAPRDAYSEKIEAAGFTYIPIEMNNKGTNPFEDLKLTASLYACYKKLSPDLILHYTIKPNIYGSMAARLLGIPTISNISGLGTVFLEERLSSHIAQYLYKIALSMPQKVFFQNPHDRELFLEKRLVPQEKTALLPGSGINLKQFGKAPCKTEPHTFCFLFIGRLLGDKGLVEFADAAKHILSLPSKERNYIEPHFCILGAPYPGNPTAISEAEVEAWEKAGTVKYLGFSDDVQTHIAAADCIVLPSYREGLSRVLLEAASMRKPIVTTDVPGCRDVVEEGVNGYLCQAKEYLSLAEAMVKILFLNEAERHAMGENGRKRVKEEFDEQFVIDRYLEAIRTILHPDAKNISSRA